MVGWMSSVLEDVDIYCGSLRMTSVVLYDDRLHLVAV